LRSVFSAVGPALHRRRPIFAREPACQPIIALSSLTDGVHLSGSSSPNPPCSAPACPRRPNSYRRADHPSSGHTTSMSTCPPTIVSRRITSSCHEASRRRCPLLCCLPSLLQPGCLCQELDDEASCACPAGRAGTIESTPSRPLRSAAHRVRVAA
jgi:hypothetical protein